MRALSQSRFPLLQLTRYSSPETDQHQHHDNDELAEKLGKLSVKEKAKLLP